MPVFFLSLLGGAKSLGGWLSRRSLIELACIVLALIAAVQTVRVQSERRHSAKLQGQVVKLNAELRKLSDAKNKQQVITKERIIVAERKRKDADDRAKVIERAPVPPNCATKPEIMGADI